MADADDKQPVSTPKASATEQSKQSGAKPAAASIADNAKKKSAADESNEQPAQKVESGPDEPNETKASAASKAGWYAIHTYSGYEEKVAENIKQRAASLDLKDKILDVIVPKEKQIEIKNGKRRVVEKRIFQGYVLVQMIMDDDSWYVVRNTPSVTGFVGSGNEPASVSEAEIASIKKRMGVEEPKYRINFSVGEVVNITDGPFKGFEANISEIDEQKGKIKVLVSIFGRETPVELDSLQVKKV